MKRFLSALLSFTLTFASLPAAAQDSSVQLTPQDLQASSVSVSVEIPETPKQVAGNVTFTYVPAEYEVKVTQGLLDENRDDPDRIVVMTGPDDPVNAILDPVRDTVVRARKRVNIPALRNLNFRGVKTSFKISGATSQFIPNETMMKATKVKVGNAFDRMAVHIDENKRKFALLVAITPAGVYGTYWFMMTHSYVRAAGNAIEGYAVYAALGMFSKEWLHFSENVMGRGLEIGVSKIYLGLLGDELSERARIRWRRTGELLTAYGLNLASMSMQYLIGGRWYGPWTSVSIAQYAVFASHDVFDFPLKSKFGELRAAMLVFARITGCMALELEAMRGNPYAEAALFVGVPTLSFRYIFREDIKEAKKRIIDRMKARFANSYVGKLIKKEKSCKEELESDRKPSSIDDAA